MKLVDENELIPYPKAGDPQTPWQASLMNDMMAHAESGDCEDCNESRPCLLVGAMLEELKKTFWRPS